MNEPIIITVYTPVYNTEAFLRQCVESVLNQTYLHFEYYLIDNGSTDGSKEILEEYAAADKRVRLIRNEKNTIPPPGAKAAIKNAIGTYYTILDSDDWWEPDYLERLLAFAEDNHLDIACTGTVMHVMATGAQSLRKLDQELILPRQAFAEAFPQYHVFFRTTWGKLIRTEHMRAVNADAIPPLVYGYDTAWCFQVLRQAGCIGVDVSVLHHYRIFGRSLSYQYNPERFESDVYLYNDAVDFLSTFGSISLQNRNFLQCVYSNAITDTVGVIHDSDLSPSKKLQEYRKIATNPITTAAYRDCVDEDSARSKKWLAVKALEASLSLGGQSDLDLRITLQTLFPRCGRSITAANIRIFQKNPELFQALLRDDADAVLMDLLIRMKNGQGVRKYAIPRMIQALAVDNPVLCQIDDAAFLRRYTKIYRMIWQGENIPALEEMTGLLLENEISGGKETFLRLYISLAALTDQAPAFVFGKLRLAWLLLRQNRREECCTAVKELVDMGVEDKELTALRQELEKQS